MPKRKYEKHPAVPRQCPYLDTINRNMLDFDFEKLCSVSLSRINVYACLVCGKYFQGRGNNTHAYTHSVSDDHHVFLNLQTLEFYCLPDNYQIFDPSLEDIIYVVNPTFSADWTRFEQTRHSRANDKSLYLPGIVGLNNIKANDYCNVVLQVLANIPPLRNFFLFPENYAGIQHPPGSHALTMFPLVTRFGELVRKLWNPRNFKSHVSPHEMLQAVVSCSKKTFQFTKQGDAIQFLAWILNTMDLGLKLPGETDDTEAKPVDKAKPGDKPKPGDKTKPKAKTARTIVSKCFKGSMVITSTKIMPVDASENEKRRLLRTQEYQPQQTTSKFFYLTCDLPIPPLFRDEKQENIIPQVNLMQLLSKFDGSSSKEYHNYKENIVKTFQLSALPPYLILYHKRFTKNTFYVEKNPTIVTFEVRSLDMADYLTPELKRKCPHAVYDLIANIVHDGKPDAGTYRCHVLHRGTGKWYEMQDLHVREIEPQMLTVSEAYIQIFELQKKASQSRQPAPMQQ